MRQQVTPLAIEIAKISQYMSGNARLIGNRYVSENFTINVDTMAFGIGNTPSTISPPTGDVTAKYFTQTSQKSHPAFYTNKQLLFLSQDYRARITTNYAVYAADVNMNAITGYLNTAHVSYGLPGSETYRILGPAAPIVMGYEPSPTPAAISATEVTRKPGNPEWQRTNYVVFGINESQEQVSLTNVFNTAQTVFGTDANQDILIEFSGILIYGNSTTNVDAFRTVFRTLGWNGSAWSVASVQGALNGMPGCGCLIKGENWKPTLMKAIVSERGYLDNANPDKVNIHRVMGRVLFASGGSVTVTAPTSTQVFGPPVAGILQAPNLYGGNSGSQSVCRYIAKRGMFMSTVPGNVNLSVWYRGIPLSSQGVEILNINHAGVRSFNFDQYSSFGTAGNIVMYAGYPDKEAWTPLAQPIYMGATSQDEGLYLLSSHTANQTITSGFCMWMDGFSLEFVDVQSAQQFDEYNASVAVMPINGAPYDINQLSLFNTGR